MTVGEKVGYFFKSSLPLSPASPTIRQEPDDCSRELTYAHSQQPDSNREPLTAERMSLTIELSAFKSEYDFWCASDHTGKC